MKKKQSKYGAAKIAAGAEFTRKALTEAVVDANGVVLHASRELGIPVQHFYQLARAVHLDIAAIRASLSARSAGSV